MKLKVAAFVLLFIALSIFSLHYVLMYQQVLAQDAQEGQLLNQVKVTKIEYNSSDLVGTDSGSFQCNLTYDNPTNSTISLSFLRVECEREESGLVHEASGVYPGTVLLYSGYSIISVELSPNLPNGTNPVFSTMADVSQGSSARVLGSMVEGGKIDNYVIGRTIGDQTYDLLSYYSTLATIVWIIGLSLACVAMLVVSKTKLQVEQWAAGVFAVNAFSVCAAFLLWNLPKPSPSVYSNYIPPGSAGMADILLNWVFLLGCGLNLYAIALLLRQSQHAKNRSYLAGGIMLVSGIMLSFLTLAPLFFGDLHNTLFFVFTLITVSNAVALIQLRRVNLNK